MLKKAQAYDGLARGLHETTRAIEKQQAQLCILADDCDQPDYKKLIEALCSEKSVPLLTVEDRETLGAMSGVSGRLLAWIGVQLLGNAWVAGEACSELGSAAGSAPRAGGAMSGVRWGRRPAVPVTECL